MDASSMSECTELQLSTYGAKSGWCTPKRGAGRPSVMIWRAAWADDKPNARILATDMPLDATEWQKKRLHTQPSPRCASLSCSLAAAAVAPAKRANHSELAWWRCSPGSLFLRWQEASSELSLSSVALPARCARACYRIFFPIVGHLTFHKDKAQNHSSFF